MTETPDYRESRLGCAARGPWGRWVAEPWPLGPDGEPAEPDPEAVERGRARQAEIWRWIEQGGSYPWPD